MKVTERRLTEIEAAAFALIRNGKARRAWPSASMKVTLDIDLKKFLSVASLAVAGMNEGIEDAASQITELARELAPEDTGALKESGQYILIDSVAPNAVSFEVRFGDDLPDARAVFQEFGTVNHDPQAYLTPAVKEIKVGAIVSKAIKKRIKQG